MENEIIEAVIVDERLDEVDHSEKKPKKPLDNHAKSIAFWGKIAAWCSRIASSALIISGLAAFVFMILSSQASPDNNPFQVLVIVCWSLAGLFLLVAIAGYIARFFMRSLKKKDPNFAESVDEDNVY